MSSPRDPGRVDDRGILPPRAYSLERRPAPRGVVLLALEGELDMAAAPALRAAIEAARAEGAAAMVVDLAKVTFVDSSALRELLEGEERMRGDGGQLVLAAIQPTLVRLLDLTRTSNLVTVTATVEEALDRVAA